MNSIRIRQTVVKSIPVVLLCLAFLLGVLLMSGCIAGAHPSQTGIMLITRPYQLV